MSSKVEFLKLSSFGLRSKIALIIVLLLGIVVIGGGAVSYFAKAEEERDLYNWQVRLGLIADNQRAVLEDWLEQQFSTLSDLAENPSLQLYLTEISLRGGTAAQDSAEATFLRNLITVTAERSGFNSPVLTSTVKASIERQGIAGIALLDKNKNIVVATPDMPPPVGKLKEFLDGLEAGSRGLLDIYLGATGEPTMAFAIPIFGIQSDHNAEGQIGLVLGVKPVTNSLYPLLTLSNTEYESQESYLVRLRDTVVEYISPQMDNTAAMIRKLDMQTPDLAAAFAISNSGGFATKRDYDFNTVLVTGRAISGTSWILVHKVNRDEAMAENDVRRKRLQSIFMLAIGLVAASIFAAWWHGSSVKFERTANEYKKLMEQFKSQEELLELVTDNEPDAVFIIDEEGKYRFANLQAAHDVGIGAADMVNKKMENVLGPEKAKRYHALNQEALAGRAPVVQVQKIDNTTLQSKHVPLERVPSLLAKREVPGVLVVEQDITDVVEEREKHEQTLEQLIEGLVLMVDKRDPYSANHSNRVAALAKAMAEEMQLDNVLVETTEIAGRLMNLGKILLPESLLTKKSALNDKERGQVAQAILNSADFLEGIEFAGPVVETLRQTQETWDGNGPQSLKGEDILVTARIIAVANAFVAMISPRSYRPKMESEDVINTLLEQIGSKFERAPVVALVNYLENHEGSNDWWVSPEQS